MAWRVGEPGAGGRCRLCDGNLDAAQRCLRCGSAHGEAQRCPHCKSVADVESSAPGRWVCRICGGPRVARRGAAPPPSAEERDALLVAAAGRRGARLSRAAAIGLGLVGTLSAALAAVGIGALDPGAGAQLAAVVVALAPWLGVPFALALARRRARGEGEALALAEVEAAIALARSSEGELAAERIAAVLGVPLARAEQLLAELHARDVLRTEFDAGGQLSYRPRARIEVSADAPGSPLLHSDAADSASEDSPNPAARTRERI